MVPVGTSTRTLRARPVALRALNGDPGIAALEKAQNSNMIYSSRRRFTNCILPGTVVVGNYDFVESKTQSNVTVRVYVPIGKKEQGAYALDTAVKALDFFEKYYNVSFPSVGCAAVSDFTRFHPLPRSCVSKVVIPGVEASRYAIPLSGK